MSTDVQLQPDGRISGIDGVLDQISEAVAKQVTPIVRDTVLPILQRDRQMQFTVGRGIGRGIMQSPALWFMAGALGMIAYTYWRNSRVHWTTSTPRSNPTRSNPTRRTRPRRLAAAA